MVVLSACLFLGGVAGVILDRGVFATFVPLSNIPEQSTSYFKLMA
jgi:hypothetical protein